MEVDRLLRRHISIVQNGRRVYLDPVEYDLARNWHTISRRKRDHFRSTNNTITSSINLAESTTTVGRSMATYAEPRIRWLCKPLLKSSSKTSRLNIHTSSQLILPSSQQCDARQGECLDSENKPFGRWYSKIVANSTDTTFYMKVQQLNQHLETIITMLTVFTVAT